MKKFTTKELIKASLFLAIGIILPMFFHFFGMTGPIFLPMHIPIFIAGAVLVPELAILVGILTPLLSSVLTGMPVLFPIGVIMMFELATYGGVVSYLTKKLKLNVILTVIIGMVSGRVVATILAYLLVLMFHIKLNPMIYIKGAIVTGFPGILIQLIIIPILIKVIKKAGMDKA